MLFLSVYDIFCSNFCSLIIITRKILFNLFSNVNWLTSDINVTQYQIRNENFCKLRDYKDYSLEKDEGYNEINKYLYYFYVVYISDLSKAVHDY